MSFRTDGCKLKVNRIVQNSTGKKNLRANIIVDARKPAPEWNKYEEILTASEGEAYVLLIFLIDGSGILWCDDISVEEII